MLSVRNSQFRLIDGGALGLITLPAGPNKNALVIAGKTAANFIEIWYLREEDNLDGNGPQYRIKGRRLTASSGPVPDTMSVWSSGGRSYVSTRGTDTTLFRSDNCGL